MHYLTKTVIVIHPWAKNATGKILTCPKYCVPIFVLIYPQLWNYYEKITLFSSPCTSPSSTQYSVPLLYLTLKYSVVQSVTVFLLIKTMNVSFVRHYIFSVALMAYFVFYFTTLPLTEISISVRWMKWVWCIGGTIQTVQNEVLREKLVPVPLHQTQIPHFKKATTLRSHWWTAWAMVSFESAYA